MAIEFLRTVLKAFAASGGQVLFRETKSLFPGGHAGHDGIAVYCPSNVVGNTATSNDATNTRFVVVDSGCGNNFNVAGP